MEWLKELLKDVANADSIAEQIKAQIPDHFVPKDKYNTKAEELKTLNDTLVQRDNDIKELKKVDPSELQGKLQTLQTTYATEKENWEKTLKENSLKSAVKMRLNGNVHDVDIALGLMDLTQIELDEKGAITKGLDEQVDSLKENKSFLFKSEQNNTGRTPPDSNKPSPSSGDDISLRAAMGLSVTPNK